MSSPPRLDSMALGLPNRSRTGRLAAAALGVWVFLAACGGTENPPFPEPSRQPVEDSSAAPGDAPALGIPAPQEDAAPTGPADPMTEGDLLLESGDPRGAIEAYTQLIEDDERNADAYLKRGIAYGELADFDSALSDLREAFPLLPEEDQWLVSYHRGRVYHRAGDFDEALTRFRGALIGAASRPPEATATIYAEMAVTLSELGEADDARAAAISALDLGMPREQLDSLLAGTEIEIAMPTGQIAFLSSRDGGGIYLTSADGGSAHRLVDDLASNLRANSFIWSPDGTQIAFESHGPKNGSTISIVNADGSGRRQVSIPLEDEKDRAPTWSPDGNWIAYHSGGALVVVSATTGDLELLITERIVLRDLDGILRQSGIRPERRNLAWSPDSRWLIYDWGNPYMPVADFEIVAVDMHAERRTQRQLTIHSPAYDLFPAWAPDGRSFVYTSAERSAVRYDLMRVDFYEEHLVPVPLTQHDASNPMQPVWSPDGTRIVYALRRGNDRIELHSISPTGNDPMQLTASSAAAPIEDQNPAWSPDGQRLAFDSNRDGKGEIYVIDANGANPVNLTNDPSNDFAPAWQPDR